LEGIINTTNKNTRRGWKYYRRRDRLRNLNWSRWGVKEAKSWAVWCSRWILFLLATYQCTKTDEVQSVVIWPTQFERQLKNQLLLSNSKHSTPPQFS
jgi:hypothetical protein